MISPADKMIIKGAREHMFETAAILRDGIVLLKKELKTSKH